MTTERPSGQAESGRSLSPEPTPSDARVQSGVLFGAEPQADRNAILGQMGKGYNAHDEWLTPPELVQALGPFDLDPCSPINRPWPTAAKHFTVADDGLRQQWEGMVWCNPPYADWSKWLRRLHEHGSGIGLIFARTETRAFFDSVWDRADALLFLRGRLAFHHVNGSKAKASAGAPSVLIAYGPEAVARLASCGLDGRLVHLREAAA